MPPTTQDALRMGYVYGLRDASNEERVEDLARAVAAVLSGLTVADSRAMLEALREEAARQLGLCVPLDTNCPAC